MAANTKLAVTANTDTKEVDKIEEEVQKFCSAGAAAGISSAASKSGPLPTSARLMAKRKRALAEQQAAATVTMLPSEQEIFFLASETAEHFDRCVPGVFVCVCLDGCCANVYCV